jgi:hypothetical protein
MEIKWANVYTYLVPGLLGWRKEFFRLKKGFLDGQSRRSLRGPW